MSPDPLHRTFLYAPGDREDLARKAGTRGADAVVLDLEDAVAPHSKADARRVVAEVVRECADSASALHVRVNRDGDGFSEEDVRTVFGPGLAALRLPKVEDPDEVARVDKLLTGLEQRAGLGVGHVALYPTVESAVGLGEVPSAVRATGRIVRFAFGASDYLADLGAGDVAADHARCELVVSSRRAGVGPPIDSVHTRLDDGDGLARACRRSRSMGMYGKSIIHPRQIQIVHRALAPDTREMAEARAVIAAWDQAEQRGQGAIDAHGQFIDPAVVARARATLQHER